MGRGPSTFFRGGYGLPSRAPVASGPGSHEGECFGEVGGVRRPREASPALRRRKDEAPAPNWARIPGSALPFATAWIWASVSSSPGKYRGQAFVPYGEPRLAVVWDGVFCRSVTTITMMWKETLTLNGGNDSDT